MNVFFRWLIVPSLFIAGAQLQAATLKGNIRGEENFGPPMPNVKVEASGANPQVSDSGGNFTLEFPKLHPGDTVVLSMAKEGYVVVNDIQLESTLPSNSDQKIFVFLLCKPELRDEMAGRFFRFKTLEALKKTQRKELELAKSAGAAAVAVVAEKYAQGKATAEKAAEELARQKPGQMSALYRKAMGLFLEGNIEQALTVLEEEKLRAMVAAAKERRAETAQELDAAIQTRLLKAQLYTVQFRFAEAENAYRSAVDAAPDDFHANFAYARFNHELYRYRKAEEAYNRCLELATRSGDKYDLGLTLNDLGLVYSGRQRPEEALEALERAVTIWKELAGSDPQYLPMLAFACNSLGDLHQAQGRFDLAEKALQPALSMGRELTKKDLQIYGAGLARTLNSLAVMHSKQGQLKEAREAFEEALTNLRRLAEREPEKYQPVVAQTLTSLATNLRVDKRIEEAIPKAEESLEINRRFASNNPETYLPEVLASLCSLGPAQVMAGHLDEALATFEEAVAIGRKLRKISPEAHQDLFAGALQGAGIVHREQGHLPESREALREALEVYQSLADANPQQFRQDVTRVEQLLRQLDAK